MDSNTHSTQPPRPVEPPVPPELPEFPGRLGFLPAGLAELEAEDLDQLSDVALTHDTLALQQCATAWMASSCAAWPRWTPAVRLGRPGPAGTLDRGLAAQPPADGGQHRPGVVRMARAVFRGPSPEPPRRWLVG